MLETQHNEFLYGPDVMVPYARRLADDIVSRHPQLETPTPSHLFIQRSHALWLQSVCRRKAALEILPCYPVTHPSPPHLQRIFLIRHGESEGNKDETLYCRRGPRFAARVLACFRTYDRFHPHLRYTLQLWGGRKLCAARTGLSGPLACPLAWPQGPRSPYSADAEGIRTGASRLLSTADWLCGRTPMLLMMHGVPS